VHYLCTYRPRAPDIQTRPMESYRESQKHLARPYRKAVLKTLLIFTAISGLLFFTLNVQRENYPLAFAELGMACYSVFILWAIGNTRHLERWILAFILPFCITMMFALTSPRATTTVFAWVLLTTVSPCSSPKRH